MGDSDFAKGASGPANPYDTTPSGLGLSPAYLSQSSATASSTGGGSTGGGWTTPDGTLSYTSVDGPTGVVATSADLTSVFSVGARIKFTQTTVKYFIVTAMTSSSLTIYGGTDYALVNAAITAAAYSREKAPVGCPLSPSMWTESLNDSSDRVQATPVSGTWYNPGAVQLSMPIGAWHLSYKAAVQLDGFADGQWYATLSKANNSNSDTDLAVFMRVAGAAGQTVCMTAAPPEYMVAVTVKTAWFLNLMTLTAATNSIGTVGATFNRTIIRAECAYL